MSVAKTRKAVDERPRFQGAWETRLLGDLGQTYGGLTGKSKDDFGHGEGRFVTFLNALDNVRLRATLLEPVDVAAGDRQNVVQPGDVIFNGTSETPGELAMGSLVPDGLPAAYLNSFCFGFRPGNDAGICSEFVAYLFRGRPGRRLLAALAQGATRYNLSKSQFRKLALSLPGLPEQRAIAAVLSDVDDLLQSLDRLIAKKRDIKTGAMQQLLTGKTRLPGFSGKWEKKRLGELGRCLRGVGYNPEHDLVLHDTDRTFRLLRSTNVQGQRLDLADLQFVDQSRVAIWQQLRTDDLVFCAANGSRALVGKSARFDVNDGYRYTFGAFMGVFRADLAMADGRFAGHLLHSSEFLKQVDLALSGSAINNLSPSQVESFSFRLPPFPNSVPSPPSSATWMPRSTLSKHAAPRPQPSSRA